jgi:outer membrane protein OmpA-like peptidoglycan-associated protein
MPSLKVYFDTGKAEVASEFSDKSKALVDYLNTNPTAKAVISGFNDPTGDPVANAALSKNRAQAVQAALVAAGVPNDKTMLEKPADATGTGVTNAASRRVEVIIRK